MNKPILFLTDYKGLFGSKQESAIYRGGMDVPLMIRLFKEQGYEANAVPFSHIDNEFIKNKRPIILYTSSEDIGGLYKSYIDDIVYHLEQDGNLVLPCFSYLQAHNDKVAMELLRRRSDFPPICTIQSKTFGTIEELVSQAEYLNYPVVIKSASGAMSRGVSRAANPIQLLRVAKKISKTHNLRYDIKECLRIVKYGNRYIRESVNRKKFIVQNMIPGMDNDWKVLVYGKRIYILFRENRKNDFRASGSGRFVFREEIPPGILDYALSIKEHFKVPHVSLDIGNNEQGFHLFEMQFLYFGTLTIEKAEFYFEKEDLCWKLRKRKSVIEEVYVRSIVEYLKDNK